MRTYLVWLMAGRRKKDRSFPEQMNTYNADIYAALDFGELKEEAWIDRVVGLCAYFIGYAFIKCQVSSSP